MSKEIVQYNDLKNISHLTNPIRRSRERELNLEDEQKFNKKAENEIQRIQTPKHLQVRTKNKNKT